MSEFRRHQVFRYFEESMGPERATTLMDLLPPVGWGDIATHGDLDALRIELRGEIAELRGEVNGLRGEMNGLRGEMDALRSEVRGEIAELRGEMAEFRGEIAHAFAKLQRNVYVATLAGNATVVGLVVALVGLR